MILLNPGPVNLSERVRQALLSPDLCHREPEFAALQSAIRRKVTAVYGLDPARWITAMLAGSGTAAVEAMLASLVPRDGRLLILDNGVYSDRMARIAEIHGIAAERIGHPWGAALDLERLRARLAAAPAVSHVAVVHHETTTGRLNDLAPIARICTAHGARLLVDAVSSFGAEAIDLEGWGVEACALSSNKCLHGIPGLALVVMRRESPTAEPPRSLYLDLGSYCRLQEQGGTPFTPAVQACYALDAALDELAGEGGWQARQARYRALIDAVRAGLVELGVRPLLDARETSCVLHAFHLPEGWNYESLHDALKAEGFVIYAGQGRLAPTIFRVSTMGAITAADMRRFLHAMVRIVGRRT